MRAFGTKLGRTLFGVDQEDAAAQVGVAERFGTCDWNCRARRSNGVVCTLREYPPDPVVRVYPEIVGDLVGHPDRCSIPKKHSQVVRDVCHVTPSLLVH